jgi:hypothetical protein
MSRQFKKKWITNELGFLAILCRFSCNRSTEAFVKTRTIGAVLSIDSLGVQTTAWVISVLFWSKSTKTFSHSSFFQQFFTRNKQ